MSSRQKKFISCHSERLEVLDPGAHHGQGLCLGNACSWFINVCLLAISSPDGRVSFVRALFPSLGLHPHDLSTQRHHFQYHHIGVWGFDIWIRRRHKHFHCSTWGSGVESYCDPRIKAQSQKVCQWQKPTLSLPAGFLYLSTGSEHRMEVHSGFFLPSPPFSPVLSSPLSPFPQGLRAQLVTTLRPWNVIITASYKESNCYFSLTDHLKSHLNSDYVIITLCRFRMICSFFTGGIFGSEHTEVHLKIPR